VLVAILYPHRRCFQSDVSKSVFTTWFFNKNFVQGIGIMGFGKDGRLCFML